MGIGSAKMALINNLKNLVGWRTNRKIVVFSVDDYGNVRLDSKKSVSNLDKAGIEPLSPFRGFDLYDSLETRNDLEALFETLDSVKDKHGNHAIFTPFAVPCNINFEKVIESGFREFHNETLTVTYNKLSDSQPSAYRGAWRMWKEGINKKFLVPQFHGREHINLAVFYQLLNVNSGRLRKILESRSYARISSIGTSNLSPSAAFDFWNLEENVQFEEIIRDGLNAFERVFGYRACHFNPPGGRESNLIHPYLNNHGIKYIDTPMIKKEHRGKGKYKTVINLTGSKNNLGQMLLVRNVVYEPTSGHGKYGAESAIRQIEAAFRWNKPAIISTHRVNFCGHIDEDNRNKGLSSLRNLLKNITKKWPDVEFMAANELADLIYDDKYG